MTKPEPSSLPYTTLLAIRKLVRLAAEKRMPAVDAAKLADRWTWKR